MDNLPTLWKGSKKELLLTGENQVEISDGLTQDSAILSASAFWPVWVFVVELDRQLAPNSSLHDPGSHFPPPQWAV